jgi:uncharacterized protein (TIGR02466 family)
MNLDLLFATPVYVVDIGNEKLNEHLEKNVIRWSEKDKGITKTNSKGWHSPTDMHQKEEYKELVNILFQAQLNIYNSEGLDSEPFLGNMWANINPPGGFNKPHIHPNSLWSGVYYIKAPEKCGNLILEDPKSVSLMVMPRRKQNIQLPIHTHRILNYKPLAGRLIMFPSWLNHWVEPNESNDIRISVSFNFLQKSFVN